MNATNSAILDQLEKGEQSATAKRETELEKANAAYWSILADPNRVSAEDKNAMAAAMKTLGKSLADADADARVIEEYCSLPDARNHIEELQKKLFDADAALREYTSVTCPKIHADMKDGIRQRTLAAQQAKNEATSAGKAYHDALDVLGKNADRMEKIKRYANVTVAEYKPRA
jgi:hypothetical protein